jgi:hypothetical protein
MTGFQRSQSEVFTCKRCYTATVSALVPRSSCPKCGWVEGTPTDEGKPTLTLFKFLLWAGSLIAVITAIFVLRSLGIQ